MEPSRIVLAGACLFLATGCEAIIPYNWDSAEKEGEHVELVLDQVSAQEAKPVVAILPREGTRAALQIDPGMFESRIGKLIAHTAAISSRPPSSWGAKAAADFYAAPPRVLGPSATAERIELRPGIRGFRLERWLGKKRRTVLEFSLEATDDAFRVRLDRICVKYSRAKVADTSWINWWSRIPLLYGFAFDIARVFGVKYGDNAIDMQVDVGFNANWTDARGESHFAPIAMLGWTVLDVPLGGGTREVGQSSGWLPLPPPSILATASGETSLGRGHIAMWTLVTEQDELAQEFIAERTTLGDYIDSVLGLIPTPVPSQP